MVETGPKSIEWAAGIFEGEGCLTYIKSNDVWEMKVKMTDEDVVQDFYEAVSWIGNYYGPRKTPSMKEHHKPYTEWKLVKRDYVFELVMLFYPKMNARRQEKMREFLNWYFRK